MRFLRAFHDEQVDLQRINRALIVLIPKTEAAATPSVFKPVSLQNCPVKILTKLLTSRLQQQISRLNWCSAELDGPDGVHPGKIHLRKLRSSG